MSYAYAKAIEPDNSQPTICWSPSPSFSLHQHSISHILRLFNSPMVSCEPIHIHLCACLSYRRPSVNQHGWHVSWITPTAHRTPSWLAPTAHLTSSVELNAHIQILSSSCKQQQQQQQQHYRSTATKQKDNWSPLVVITRLAGKLLGSSSAAETWSVANRIRLTRHHLPTGS